MRNLQVLRILGGFVVRLKGDVSLRSCRSMSMKKSEEKGRVSSRMAESSAAFRMPSGECSTVWTDNSMKEAGATWPNVNSEEKPKRQREDSTSQLESKSHKKSTQLPKKQKKVNSPRRPDKGPSEQTIEQSSRRSRYPVASANPSTSAKDIQDSVTASRASTSANSRSENSTRECIKSVEATAQSGNSKGPTEARHTKTRAELAEIDLRDCLKCRSWDLLPGNAQKKYVPLRSRFSFKVASYNVLAQDLMEMHPDLYRDTPEKYLAWDYRKKNLMAEMEKYSPDIFCLQEVQGTHFQEFFQPELAKRGYQGVHKARTGDKSDGCAIFFNVSKFHLEDSVPLSFYRREVDVLDRDNVGLLVKLSPVSRRSKIRTSIVVATTHLLFNPRRGDVKLAQLMLLLAELDKFSFDPLSLYGQAGHHCPVILAGDFNSTPFSPLYDFLAHGRLNLVDLCQRFVSGQSCWEYGGPTIRRPPVPPSMGIMDTCQYFEQVMKRLSMGQQGPHVSSEQNPADSDCKVESASSPKPTYGGPEIAHSFQFRSVYDYDPRTRDKDMTITSSHKADCGNVDYIFYHSSSCHGDRPQPLQLCKRLKLLNVQDQYKNQIFLPNKYVSSDHIILLAEFFLRLE